MGIGQTKETGILCVFFTGGKIAVGEAVSGEYRGVTFQELQQNAEIDSAIPKDLLELTGNKILLAFKKPESVDVVIKVLHGVRDKLAFPNQELSSDG